MKEILNGVNPISKHIFFIGLVSAALIVAVSAAAYFGAGILWDYYRSIALSEKLLAVSRPVAVTACIVAVLCEYSAKNREEI